MTIYVTHLGNLSPDFLLVNQFQKFERIPKLSFARPVLFEELPLTIEKWGETWWVDNPNYFLVLDSDGKISHPVDANAFSLTYKVWEDEISPEMADFCAVYRCAMYRKVASVFAKLITHDNVFIQGMEHRELNPVPKGNIVVLGAVGEPYHMPLDEFCARYKVTVENADGAITISPLLD
jgi:hypothetical protein